MPDPSPVFTLIHAPVGPELEPRTDPDRSDVWTGAWVKIRMVEAFEIERRMPGRVGPVLLRSGWADRQHR